MFTGIVREVGSVVSATGGAGGVRLEIAAPRTAPLVGVGGSVSVNGVCLTAESVDGDTLVFHAVPETLSRSTLGGLGSGAGVNLEPALLPVTRSAATSSRAMSTASAACSRSRPRERACA